MIVYQIENNIYLMHGWDRIEESDIQTLGKYENFYQFMTDCWELA